jgi:uncharacterized OB-fold protein
MLAARTNTFEGKVVRVAGNKLVTTSPDASEHTHTVAADAKVTALGKAAKTEDLKAGMHVRVTTKASDKDLVTHIDAVGPDEERPRTHVGKVVRATNDTLVTSNQAGKEFTRTLSADAKVTSEGKARKASDLKPGMAVRITSKPGDKTVAIGVDFTPVN